MHISNGKDGIDWDELRKLFYLFFEVLVFFFCPLRDRIERPRIGIQSSYGAVDLIVERTSFSTSTAIGALSKHSVVGVATSRVAFEGSTYFL